MMKHKIACTHTKLSNLKKAVTINSPELIVWALNNEYLWCDGDCNSLDCVGGWLDHNDDPVDILYLYFQAKGK